MSVSEINIHFSHVSISSPFSRRPSAFQNFSLRKKADVDITLERQETPFNVYSTYDEIKGQVVISFDRNTEFEDVMITFEGQAATFVEKIATTAPTTGRTTGRHTFLKLLQPNDPARLPADRIAKAGVRYELPFTFVVPDRLLPHICRHGKATDEVKEAHLRLPPSLGDPMHAGDGPFIDDMAPEMSRITYQVRVRLTKRSSSGRLAEIANKSIKIKLIPRNEEQPPMNVTEEQTDYELRKEKDVKRGLFKLGKIGRLTAEVTQPQDLILPPPRSRSNAPISTITAINLRFDPYSPNDQPPALGSIVSKLRVETFYGATPFKDIPSKSTTNPWDTMKGFYCDSVELSSRCISTVHWIKHEDSSDTANAQLARRPSLMSTASTASIPKPSTAYAGAHFWTASVLVPIALPVNKSFPPSFSTCIVTRSYILDLNMSYHTPGTNVSNPSILLKVPIRISSEGNPGTNAPETATAEEVDRYFFTPRSIAPPSPEYTERAEYDSLGANVRHASIAAPPEYHPGFAGIRGVDAPPNPPRAHSVGVRAAC